MGIVAATTKDSEYHGIMLLNYLPACNHCNRMSKPDQLKKCSRCKSATYCSKECQAADWDSHHKTICKKGSGAVDSYDGSVKLYSTPPDQPIV